METHKEQSNVAESGKTRLREKHAENHLRNDKKGRAPSTGVANDSHKRMLTLSNKWGRESDLCSQWLNRVMIECLLLSVLTVEVSTRAIRQHEAEIDVDHAAPSVQQDVPVVAVFHLSVDMTVKIVTGKRNRHSQHTESHVRPALPQYRVPFHCSALPPRPETRKRRAQGKTWTPRSLRHANNTQNT